MAAIGEGANGKRPLTGGLDRGRPCEEVLHARLFIGRVESRLRAIMLLVAGANYFQFVHEGANVVCVNTIPCLIAVLRS